MIRPATHSDIPRILELGALMHATTDYAALPFNPDRAGEFIASLIGGAGVVFLAEVDGVVVGGIAGGLGQQWFNDELFAFEIALFLEPSRRHGITAIRLIRAFTHWAKGRGARHIEAGITTGRGVEGISRLYHSEGFLSVHPMFKKEL